MIKGFRSYVNRNKVDSKYKGLPRWHPGKESSHQGRRHKKLRLDPWPRGMVWGGKREESSGWGTHVNLWRIHFDIWQNQYNIVKLKNKIKLKKKKKKKEMATHFSIFAWKIQWTEEPGRLQYMGCQRVGSDWVTDHTQEKTSWGDLLNRVDLNLQQLTVSTVIN